MGRVLPSRCRDCDVDIYWAEKTPGKFARPLEKLGVDWRGLGLTIAPVFVDERYGRIVEPVGLYRWHTCEPEDVARRMEERREMEAYREAYEAARAAAVATAMGCRCKRCGVEPGEACRDLRKGERYRDKTTKWPHKERMPEGWEAGLRPIPNEPPEVAPPAEEEPS